MVMSFGVAAPAPAGAASAVSSVFLPPRLPVQPVRLSGGQGEGRDQEYGEADAFHGCVVSSGSTQEVTDLRWEIGTASRASKVLSSSDGARDALAEEFCGW
jgi:hypothetical protein